ncbi:LacI family DNA-binding transcriptional regulator [Modestobacter sp. VKM Ac-2982]|nr:LacI family DNA-binding transcriptional regulator [Modestobacter sp. VKM Ac-2981]MCZ2851387.1 LacI family DNA-binding transcriptional regulator [Modestobacter sp. VKM Ac-2982]
MRQDHRPAVTIEHVARAAGVSRATVSRVLTGSGPFSADAGQRVRATAERLGYTADPVARALVHGRGTRLVVAVTSASPTDLVDCQYVSRVVGSAAQRCAGEGLGVALQWLPLGAPEPALEALARDRSVAGVVLVDTTRRVLAAVPPRLAGRVVSIGAGSSAVPLVDVDTGAAATALTAHLLRSGRRRIAMLAGPPWLPCADRPVAAYQAAVRAAGLPERVLAGDFTTESGRLGAAEALRRWPDTDALYAICDETAFGAIQAVRALGRRVPDDVAVTGFDDLPLAAFSGPALTTATHPVEQIAARAAATLLDRDRTPVTLFPSELVVRQSA